MHFLALTFFFLTATPTLLASTSDISPDLLAGDELYQKRADIRYAYQALSLFEKHLDSAPKDPQALWRASMANYYTGHLIENQEQRVAHYKKGVAQGELCVRESNAQMVQCYFWLGTNTALLKKESGIFSLAFGISGIISLFKKALLLGPQYAGSGPHRMLALLHYKAPGILGGDSKKAYSYIRTAIEVTPDEPLNHYFYLKFLHEDHKTEEALKVGKDFVAKFGAKEFSYFESQTAYKNILHFIDHRELPKED